MEKQKKLASFRETDQERVQVQNIPELLMKHWHTEFEITQKLNGASMTAYLKDGVFGVCSRNLELEESKDNKYWQVARENQLEKILRHLGRNLAFQGEICGPGIQENNEKLDSIQFFLFDVYDIDAKRYLTWKERTDLAKGDLGVDLKTVPGFGCHIKTIAQFVSEFGFTDEVIEANVLELLPSVVKDETVTPEDLDEIQCYLTRSLRLECLMACANGLSSLNEAVKRKGIVFNSSELLDYGKVLSFKVISNNYLEGED